MIVFAVYKNSDMTEGRGPMVLDKLFLVRKMAVEYANSQKGVMGTSPFRDHKRARDVASEQYKAKWDDPVCGGWFCKACHPSGGTWQIREFEVVTEGMVTGRRGSSARFDPLVEMERYRSMADRLQGEIDRLIGVIEQTSVDAANAIRAEAGAVREVEAALVTLQAVVTTTAAYLDQFDHDGARTAATTLRYAVSKSKDEVDF